MKQLIEDSIRGYESSTARRIAIHQLAKAGYNYFVPFRDVNSAFALQYGIANWVLPGEVHVDGGWYYKGHPASKGRHRPRCLRPWVADPYTGLRVGRLVRVPATP